MNAPRFQPGARVRDYITGIPLVVVAPLSERHPKSGDRLYLTRSKTGTERRLQERNLRPSSN